MKRRSFVKASLLTGSLSGISNMAGFASDHSATQKKGKEEFYELRTYLLKNQEQQKLVEDYFRDAAIPALNRLGSRNIGVFRELTPGEVAKLFVLIPFPSLGDFLRVHERLANDAAYLKTGALYLEAPATAAAYERIESSIFKAFSGMPKIEVPEKKSRIFELRRYESSGEMAAKKKIEMFNSAGEISIFKRVGLTPVFFGEALIGQAMPNLTYMLTFDDMAEHDQNWKTFGSDPDWKKISAMPEYANAKIVSKITRTFLTPADFSQV